MLARPLLVVGDAHLPHAGGTAVSRDLARLVQAHPGHEVLLNGDTLTLSADPPARSAYESVGALLGARPVLCQALGDHVRHGSRVTWLAGNHDAALMEPAMRYPLLRALGLPDDAPLRTAPWFERRGSVHVEHGHLYDPDNAPTHPLVPVTPATEPLGVALTRRFVAAQEAWEFAHAHETTFAHGLLRAFRRYGRRAPGVVAEYYRTAVALFLEAGEREDINRERAEGDERVALAAEGADLSVLQLRELLRRVPPPTHHSRGRTFRRLYLDRTLAGALLIGAGAGLGPGGAIARAVALPSAAYLAGSILRRPNRYRGRLEERLRDAAQRVADITDASVVVFGHTHHADANAGYFNPGSFGLAEPGRRGYVVVAEDGHAEQRWW